MRWHSSLFAAATLAGTAAIAPSAHAAGAFLGLPAAVPGLVMNQPGCQASLLPALGSAQPALPSAPVSKSSALLGGRVSQLELIAAQQGAVSPATAGQPARMAAKPAGAGSGLPGKGLEPGAGGIGCAAFASAAAATRDFTPGLRGQSAGADDFLASRRLTVARTAFDSSWGRVRAGKVPAAIVQPMSGLSTRSRLAAVNGWANDHIRYVEDQDLYGRADFWAPAANTIGIGAGDCEDIAIVKMQMLAALGVDRADMFLTVARDRIRNRDHAVLIVKAEGQYWMLDNATNAVLDASQNHDYMPILTFGENAKWLHGF